MKTIRLWKVGVINPLNPLSSLTPSSATIQKVRDLVQSVKDMPDNNIMDIIWGPDLNIELHVVDDHVENYVLGPDNKLVKVTNENNTNSV